ncbi:MAG TPA: dipeptide epimerase [Candidatus Kapabacteria bacterium]|nr:dipeptide epimerase [Candidatus Kapabacteria bacterium]
MKRRIESIRAEYFQIPLKNPFILSIRSALHANVIRWHLRTDDGREFPGESVPVQYVTGETPETVLAAVPKIEALLHGALIEDLPHLIHEMGRALPNDIAARAGVEIAIYNAFAAETGIALEKLLGSENVTLETDLTIARIPNALEVARQAWLEGFRIFKMKVGGGAMEEDIDRILGIAEEFPEAVFRLDANQSLTPRSTVKLAEALLRNDITLELIEQPVPKEDLAALDEVARICPIPIIADEACRTPAEAYRIFSETAVQGVNVKLMKSGIGGALDIIRIAKAAGRKLMIGCMLESEIGMAASVALACGTGAFDYIDLDGHLLLDLKEPISLFSANGPRISTKI